MVHWTVNNGKNQEEKDGGEPHRSDESLEPGVRPVLSQTKVAPGRAVTIKVPMKFSALARRSSWR
jgi:hypothetical protein